MWTCNGLYFDHICVCLVFYFLGAHYPIDKWTTVPSVTIHYSSSVYDTSKYDGVS